MIMLTFFFNKIGANLAAPRAEKNWPSEELIQISFVLISLYMHYITCLCNHLTIIKVLLIISKQERLSTDNNDFKNMFLKYH